MVRTCIIATACVASTAIADTVDVDFVGFGSFVTGQVSIGNFVFDVPIGQIRSDFTNGTGPNGGHLSGELITFCIEAEEIDVAPVTYEVTDVELAPENSPMGPAEAQTVFNVYAYTAANLGNPFGAGATDALAAAFQLALWELTFDPGNLDIHAGIFSVNSLDSDAAAINSHVTAMLMHASGSASGDGLLALSDDVSQDQIVLVPLPAPAMLGAAGLGGVAFVRRRRVRGAV